MYGLSLPDLIAVFGTLADAIGESFVALALGFAATPTGIGFLLGAVLVLIFGSVVPVSFQVESLTVVSKLGERKWEKMCQIVLTAGIIGAVLGIIGAYSHLYTFIEGPILFGMMTGAGLILSFVAIELVRENKLVGGASVLTAFVVFFATPYPDNIIYGLGASVIVAIIVARVAARYVPFEPIPVDPEKEKVRLIPLDGFRFLTDSKVIMGALALLALRTGTSITFTEIDAGMAGVEGNVDHTNIISGLSGAASALFGGAPVEPIIAGTAASPHPVSSAALMMAIMGGLLLFGVIPKLAQFIPPAAISGFLIMLGSLVVLPDNIPMIVTDADPVSGPVTAAVTAGTFNPFIGMVAGVIVRFIYGPLIGLL